MDLIISMLNLTWYPNRLGGKITDNHLIEFAAKIHELVKTVLFKLFVY